MCGIFAYINHLVSKEKKELYRILINGLMRLEYRGYDSAGVAVDTHSNTDNSSKDGRSHISIIRSPGKVATLKKKVLELNGFDDETPFDTHVGIAHTRWATHGEPSEVNSHPQRSGEDNEFVVVHNGIVTNYKDLKQLLLEKGFEFESDTDTECIAQLCKHIYNRCLDEKTYPCFRDLVGMVVAQLEGAFALCFKSVHFPGEIVAARRGSPLLVGVKTHQKLLSNRFPIQYNKGSSKDAFSPTFASRRSSETVITPIEQQKRVEYFFASDASAVIEHTNEVIYLEDDDIAAVDSSGTLTITRFQDGKSDSPTHREVTTLKMEIQEIMRGNFNSFFEKEIFEQAESVMNTLRGRLDFDNYNILLGGLQSYSREIRRCRRMIFIGCGTSYNSAIATRQLLEELTELPVMVELASDFLDRKTPIFRDDVCFFISQSGETADTLMALRYCKEQRALVVGITNTVGSSISRETYCGIHINAGPEIGVASTKAYTSQFISLVLFGLMMSEDKISMLPRRRKIIDGIRALPDAIRRVLAMKDSVKTLGEELSDSKSLLIMGRGYDFATCLEGALKIKELTYIHCEGILAGELKHGPLAMVDEDMPSIMICLKDNVYTKCVNAIQQVLARSGRPVIIHSESDTAFLNNPQLRCTIPIPDTVDCLQGIISIIPFQLLSLYIAEKRNLDVDCPRNLAKSVTVE